jgi:hypothetical protein
MSIELSEDQKSEIVAETMLNDIETIDDLITANHQYHFENKSPFAPMFSWEYDDELRRLKKMRKAFIKVHNWHSVTKYKES